MSYWGAECKVLRANLVSYWPYKNYRIGYITWNVDKPIKEIKCKAVDRSA